MPATDDIATVAALAKNGYRGRFAPSPTGPLHLGSLVAAFGSWLLARHACGEWLIRVEDLDPPREVSGAADGQLQTLNAFGLVSDRPVVRQSERGALYAAALAQMRRDGIAFDCSCSRSDLAADAGIHRACRARPSPHASAETASGCAVSTHAQSPRSPTIACRFRVADGTSIAFDDAIQGRFEQRVDRDVGDFVLRRADGFWAYQLAVVVDDADQGITHVVRGADLLDSTPRQILLQRALALPTPIYAHLPLIIDDNGQKLSKSLMSLPVAADQPLPSLRLAWQALGQPVGALRDAVNLDRMLARAVAEFDLSLIPRKSIGVAALHNSVLLERT